MRLHPLSGVTSKTETDSLTCEDKTPCASYGFRSAPIYWLRSYRSAAKDNMPFCSRQDLDLHSGYAPERFTEASESAPSLYLFVPGTRRREQETPSCPHSVHPGSSIPKTCCWA